MDLSTAGVALATEGLGFVYPDGTRALSAVSITVDAGSRVALVGQNGSGKSTLVRHFNGLLRATEGRVLVGGQDIADRHVAGLARLVGISFQNPDRQIFARSVRAEVEFGPRNIGLRGAERDEAVDAALDSVGLGGRGGVNPYDLGYSERKLLALSSVLAMRTPAVVLDEPTTGQDAHGVRRVGEVVAALGEAGRTVLAISHDMSFVADNFDRVIVMGAGTVLLDGSVGDVFDERNWPILESTYLEPPLPARLGARLGLGSTPTSTEFVAAVSRRGALRDRPR